MSTTTTHLGENPLPRKNSDEEPEWGDEPDYVDLTEVIANLELSETSNLDDEDDEDQ